MEEIEKWRDIPSYLGLYQASNLGRIRTYPKVVSCYNANGDDIKMTIGGEVLSTSVLPNGYERVTLYERNNCSAQRVHRLVAMAFIPNPNGYPIVNHKDENPLNNRADNLEWCTQQYNVNYGTAQERKGKSRRKTCEKTIGMFSLDGKLLKTFKNFVEIEEYMQRGGLHGNIIPVCKGRRNQCLGYKWKIIDEN